MKITSNLKTLTTTQTEMARALGMSQQRVSQLLKEEVMITDSDGALLILESLKNFYKLRAGAASAGDELDYMQEKAQHERIPLLHKIGRAKVSGIALVMLGVDDGKQQVMNRLAIEEPGPQYFHFPKNDDTGYDDLYFKGIISEHKKQVIRGGQIKEIWETTTGIRNEPLDLRVYNLACMKSLNIDWKKQFSLLHPEGVRADEPIRKAPVREAEKPKSRQVNIW